MKILITGGAGFIGCHASHTLSKKHEVLVLDNLSRKGSVENLAWLKKTTSIQFEQVDICSTDQVMAAFKVFKPDAVLHLAAQVAVTTSVLEPRQDFEINALGTFNILEATRQACPKATFIYSSTNKVYGGMENTKVVLEKSKYKYETLIHGVDENYPLDFHSPYGCSKGAADQYVRDYARIYNLNTVVFRQSCIYGTRQFGVEDQGWLAWFAIAASLGNPITIYGDGKQVRDVLWVADLIDAFEKTLDQMPRVRGEIFNVGGGIENSVSLLESIKYLESCGKYKIPLHFADWRPGDQKIFISNTEKLKRTLNWVPKTSVENGISQLVKWVLENRELFSAKFNHAA